MINPIRVATLERNGRVSSLSVFYYLNNRTQKISNSKFQSSNLAILNRNSQSQSQRK